MSNREIAIDLINQIPDYKMAYIVSFLKGFQMDDEIEDELFCQRLVKEYEEDDSPDKDEFYTIEEVGKMLGLKDEV